MISIAVNTVAASHHISRFFLRPFCSRLRHRRLRSPLSRNDQDSTLSSPPLSLPQMSVTSELRRRVRADPSQPRFEPCLPRSAEKPPSGPEWIHEIKHDGFRLMSYRDASGVRLITRNGRDFSDRFPTIRLAAAALPVQSCIIDGEVIACDDDGVAVFELIRNYRTVAWAVHCAFDLLEINGEDLRKLPIEVRKQTLATLLHGSCRNIVFNQHFDGDGAIIYKHACALGCEGIVSKQLGSPYQAGRSAHWLKIKNPAAPAVKGETEEDWS
jgi:bifunctional non-homologous end joining protein LigD